MRQGDRQIHVLVLEDDAPTRQRICKLLEEAPYALKVVWSGATAEDALSWLATEHAFVEVALVDLGLPGLSGPDVIRTLAQRAPHMALVALTVFDDVPTVLAVLKAGAVGYLTKHATGIALAEATYAASRGGSPMTPHVARLLLNVWRGARADPFDHLAPREQEVLTLLASGLSYGAIGERLAISLGTVQGYVKSIYGKLRVNSKAEAVRLAKRHGVLSPSSKTSTDDGGPDE